MTNNRIVGPLYAPYAAVNLVNIDTITLINNAIYQADPKTTILLQTSSVVNPQGNLTAGVYFNQTSDIPVLPDWPGIMDASTSAKPNAASSSVSIASIYLWSVVGSLLWASGAFIFCL